VQTLDTETERAVDAACADDGSVVADGDEAVLEQGVTAEQAGLRRRLGKLTPAQQQERRGTGLAAPTGPMQPPASLPQAQPAASARIRLMQPRNRSRETRSLKIA
jgi:hypothetical protein